MEEQKKSSNRDVEFEENSEQLFDKREQLNKRESVNYHQKYLSFFIHSDRNIAIDQVVRPFAQELTKNRIEYDQNKFQSQFTVTIINSSQKTKVLNLIVHFSYFTLQITALNMAGDSIFHQLPKIGYGASSNIYKLESESKEQTVIKSLRIKNEKLSHEGKSLDFKMTRSLKQAIKEYCFGKLFSILQIGPKVMNNLGFDFLLFQSTVDFCLQLCLPIKYFDMQPLKKSLRFLHILQIIHGDIKTDNIMWSKLYDKIVLIDFGFSMVLPEKPGQYSFVHYFGTLGYCSPEMSELFYKNSFGEVDLYYNDTHCLEKSARSFKSPENASKFEESKISQQLTNYLINFKLIRLIYERDIHGIYEFLVEFQKFIILQETIQLFKELPSEKILYQIFSILQKHHLLSNEETNLIKRYHYRQNTVYSQLIQKPCFLKRIQGQNLTRSPPITWFMSAIFVFLEQDVSPRAKQRKIQLEEQLKGFNEINIQFCKKLTQYISNLYTTRANIFCIFDLTRSLLKLQGKKNSQSLSNYEIYQEAFQIAQIIFQKYSINLLQLSMAELENYRVSIRAQLSEKIKEYVHYFNHWEQKIQSVSQADVPKRIGADRMNMMLKRFVKLKKQIVDKNGSSFLVRSGRIQEEIFSTECSKFYAAEKCLVMILMASKNEEECWYTKDLQTYLFFQQKRARLSINYCLYDETLFYFKFVNILQSQMLCQKPFHLIESEINKIEKIFESFGSLKMVKNFVDFLLPKVIRYRHYEIYRCEKMGLKFTRCIKQLLEKVLQRYGKSFSIQVENTILKIFVIFAETLPLKQFYTFSLFLQQDKWPSWQDQLTEKYEQKINYLAIKFNLCKTMKCINYQLYLKELKSAQHELCKMRNLPKACFYLFCLQFYIIHSPISIPLQNYINSLLLLIHEFTVIQFRIYLQNFAIRCSVQTYFARNLSLYFEDSCKFLQKYLKMYTILEDNKIGRQFEFYIIVKQFMIPFLKSQYTPQLLGLYLEKFDLNKIEGDVKWMGNLIIIYEVLLVNVFTFNLMRETKNIMVPTLKRISKVINDTSFYIRRRFNTKYFTLLLAFIQNQLLQVPKSKVRYFKVKQFRNPQYALKPQQVIGLMEKKKQQSEVRYYDLIKIKLKKWNNNKNKKLILTSINLTTPYDDSFSKLINQDHITNNLLKNKK